MMSFRDTETIDIIVDTSDRENGVDLVIVETPDDNSSEAERYHLLLQKPQTYVDYVMSLEFSERFPDTHPANVVIRVFYTTPPNDEMAEIVEVGPEDDWRIPVIYQDFDEIPE